MLDRCDRFVGWGMIRIRLALEGLSCNGCGKTQAASKWPHSLALGPGLYRRGASELNRHTCFPLCYRLQMWPAASRSCYPEPPAVIHCNLGGFLRLELQRVESH